MEVEEFDDFINDMRKLFVHFQRCIGTKSMSLIMSIDEEDNFTHDLSMNFRAVEKLDD